MKGLGTLVRLILRRDRIKLPVSIIGFILLLVLMVPLLSDVYGDEESLATVYATFSANPAGMFMTGPMDEPTFGAFFMLETLIWWGVAIAFINTLLIVRHTRHNEEIGAQELLLSGQVHRTSSLAAALLVAFGVNALIVVGVGVGLESVNPDWATSQSWLFALAMGLFGFVWATIAATIVQLAESGRGANSALAGLIGLGFILRGIGDFLGEVSQSGIHQAAWVSSLSPFGWMQAVRPLTESNWTPLIMSLGFSGVLAALAFWLLSRRDVGAGLLPSRRGKLRASRLLSTPIGLTLYLQRNIFIGWLSGVVIMVATIGVLVPQMSDVYSSSDAMRRTIEAIGGSGALVPIFMSAMLAITCLMVFAYSIHGLGRLRSEESRGHLESVLATSLSRSKCLSLHAITVILGGTIMLAIAGGGLAFIANSLSEVNVDVWEYTLGALSYVPVLMAFMSLYLLLFGLSPRLASGVAWLYFSFVAFVLWLGPIVQLDPAIGRFSVLDHVAAAPAEDINVMPLIVIAAASIVLAGVGFISWRQRDLT